MKKIYLLGGEGILKRDSEEINKKALKDAGESPIVLVFPWVEKLEKKSPYRESLKEYLIYLGAKEVIFSELEDSLESIKIKIKNSNLIYLPGGDQKILGKNLEKIKELLKNFKGVIIGNSAGALVLGQKFIYYPNYDLNKEEIISGLGLLDFSLIVHYKSKVPKFSWRTEEFIRELSIRINSRIYAIPEKSALIYSDRNIKKVGKVECFFNGKKFRSNLFD